MSDLCSPIYVVLDGDEESTFWCFVELMNRMVRLLHIYTLASSDVPLENEFPT